MLTKHIFPGIECTSVKDNMENYQDCQHQVEEFKSLDGTELTSIGHIETTGKYDNSRGCLKENFQHQSYQMNKSKNPCLCSISKEFGTYIPQHFNVKAT